MANADRVEIHLSLLISYNYSITWSSVNDSSQSAPPTTLIYYPPSATKSTFTALECYVSNIKK